MRTGTNQLVQALAQSNPQLRQSGGYSNVTLAGRAGLATVLTNVSDVTRQQERIALYTTRLNDGSLFFVVGVAPAREFNSYRQIFNRSVQSLQLNDGYQELAVLRRRVRDSSGALRFNLCAPFSCSGEIAAFVTLYGVGMTSPSMTILSASVVSAANSTGKCNLRIGTTVALMSSRMRTQLIGRAAGLGSAALLALGVSAFDTTAWAAVELRFLCEPVQAGDTATKIAARLMSRDQSWREPTLQIFDPIGARFIPKSQYSRIQPNWQACVVDSSASRFQQSSSAFSVPQKAPTRRANTAAVMAPKSTPVMPTLTYVWLSLTLVCFGWAANVLIRDESSRRDRVTRTLEGFGQAFVREFERPLGAERSRRAAVLARLSVDPRRGALDVLLAPADERRYPNLADHRANVDNDVHRILATLNDQRFACGPLEARGPWVAVPLRMVQGLHREGVV